MYNTVTLLDVIYQLYNTKTWTEDQCFSKQESKWSNCNGNENELKFYKSLTWVHSLKTVGGYENISKFRRKNKNNF